MRVAYVRTDFIYDGLGRLRRQVLYYAKFDEHGDYVWVESGSEIRYCYDGMHERDSDEEGTGSLLDL